MKVDFGKVFKGKSDKVAKPKAPASTAGMASKKKQNVSSTRPSMK